ncbi:MAG: hypothetical protein RI564_00980 [Gracilimonas sp.]|nr:hypothetical protein [Gracilimonas sp.]
MSNEKIPHGHAIELADFDDQNFEYQLLVDEDDDSQDFKPIREKETISIDPGHHVLVIRYEYKNRHTDGFQITERTHDVQLVGRQFRMVRDKGKLWSVNVFNIVKSRKNLVTNHDSDLEPPEPTIP